MNYVSSDEYQQQVKDAKLFMYGKKEELLKEMKEKMQQASNDQDYEQAAVFRDRLHAVQSTLEPQKIESRKDQRDADAVGISGDADASLIKMIKVRRGRVVGTQEIFVEEPINASSEILRAFLHYYYLGDVLESEVPSQILISSEPNDQHSFSEVLSERVGRKVKIYQPRRGSAVKILKLASKNAELALKERKRKSEHNEKLLGELQKTFRLRNFPERIEGYDISSFQGAEPVGAQVVFVHGESDKTQYRHYKIKTIKGSNDFGMMKEMFQRRFKKLEEEGDAPDLILVDGGRGQLRQALDVLSELQIDGMDVISLAKEKDLKSQKGTRHAPERVFLPGQKNPVILSPSSKVLHLLQRVRDESHRFGVTHHRRGRSRSTLQSVLGRIPGVGPKRQKLLLKSLGSVERVRNSTLKELTSVSGVDESTAQNIVNFFRSQREKNIK